MAHPLSYFRKIHLEFVLLSLCFLSFCQSFAQNNNEVKYTFKPLQFSVFPGLSTNGINPGQYKNGISINILSGYSAGNTAFEVAGLSNFNKYSSYGIQLAGFINTIGGDIRLHKKYSKQESEQLKAGFTGIQTAGLFNVLTGDIEGIQITAGANLLGGSATGFQLAGLANLNKEYFTGFQIAGIINFTGSFTSGVHLSGIMNYSSGELYGIQIAPFNRASTIYGIKSQVDIGYGLQMGLINSAKDMDGYQIGLINKAKNVKGLQIGLINIYRKNKEGIPIALINYGNGSESLNLWISETFLVNIGLGTGSEKVRNTISFSYSPFVNPNWPRRAFGYAISRIWHVNNGKQFKSIEMAFSWLNYEKVIKENAFNLLITPRYVYGVHIGRGIYFNIGGGVNYFIYPIENQKNIGVFKSPVWPSIIFGFHTD